jgi:beta-glucosidase
MKHCFSKIIFSCLLSLSLVFQAGAQDIYKDETAPVHDRIMNLLSKMTVDEKISVLWTTSPGVPRLGIEKYYLGNECLHGVVRPGRFTVFPQSIGLAAMFDEDLEYRIATAISDEARAKWNEFDQGKNQKNQFCDLLAFFSPTVNMARDPRWGRTPETYGEDPYLTGRMGTQFVKGLQGNDPHYLKVASTAKHFVANNEDNNRASCNAEIPEKILREYYLPAFEALVRHGHVESVMTAYNAINGVPCTANTWLLRNVLRGDWGFGGYVVSDCGGPSQVVTHHKYVKTKEVASAILMRAGLDVECGDDVYADHLRNAYRNGLVTEAEIDSAAYHVLRTRMKLGMFDDASSNPYTKISPSVIGCKEHQDLALQAARESIVLLKNENNMLPINPKKTKSIAVVGINAGHCEFGDYSGTPVIAPISILQGIQERAGNDVKVVYAPWVSAANGFEMIRASYFPDGLKAEYFDNTELEGTPRSRKESVINFDPASQPPDPIIKDINRSIRWTGKLRPDVTGRYVLAFTTDEGCRLFIDGKKVIDHWQGHGVETDSVAIDLIAGKEYDLKAEYFDCRDAAIAKLQWRVPQQDVRKGLERYGDAAKAVRECQTVVAVLGTDKTVEREGHDRDNIYLSDDQMDFIKEVFKVNHNVIVVLVSGSSLAINWIDDNIPAIVNAWYPGESGGRAVAEVLFGDYNPAGRLPLTYYKSMDDLPDFNDYDIRHGRTYQYFMGEVLYPFGYGLSYTSFKYSNLKVADGDKEVSVSFDIKNVGRRDGEDVPQVYVRLPERNEIMPIKELRGFDRVSIKKGGTKRVTIALDKDLLRYWDEKEGRFVHPSGTYTIMVGASSEDLRLKAEVSIDNE